jgi:hypothetical protein
LTFDSPRPPTASKSVCSDKVSTQRQAQTGRSSGSARNHGYSILNWLIDYQACIVHGPCVSQSSTLTIYDQTQGVSALVLAFGAARLKSRSPPASNPAGTCDRKGRAHERRWIISVWLHGRIDADYDLRDLGSLAARGSNLTAAMTVYPAVVLLFARRNSRSGTETGSKIDSSVVSANCATCPAAYSRESRVPAFCANTSRSGKTAGQTSFEPRRRA